MCTCYFCLAGLLSGYPWDRNADVYGMSTPVNLKHSQEQFLGFRQLACVVVSSPPLQADHIQAGVWEQPLAPNLLPGIAGEVLVAQTSTPLWQHT